MPTFTKDTLIPAGLVVTALGVAMSFGVLYQRVNTVEERTAELSAMRDDVAQIKTDVAVIKSELIRRPSGVSQK